MKKRVLSRLVGFIKVALPAVLLFSAVPTFAQSQYYGAYNYGDGSSQYYYPYSSTDSGYYSSSGYSGMYPYHYPYYPQYPYNYGNYWNNDFSVYCAPATYAAQVGTPVNWRVYVYGGMIPYYGGQYYGGYMGGYGGNYMSGYYTYSWSGTDGITSLNLPSINIIYPTPGTKSVSVTVSSGSRTKTAYCGTVNVFGYNYGYPYPYYPGY